MTGVAEAKIERIIRPKHGLISIDFKELWRYRELFGFLAWRNILIRYKQTVIGIVWAVIRPTLTNDSSPSMMTRSASGGRTTGTAAGDEP